MLSSQLKEFAVYTIFMKTVAILQPNYIPWKGYFDLIASCDLFVLYDDVQYTKNDWRNRNLIKTPSGVKWLTIPVGGKINREIREVEISDPRWSHKHWKSLLANYARARFAGEIFDLFKPVYLSETHSSLVAVNRRLIELVCSYLRIKTEIRLSSEFSMRMPGSDGVLALCETLGATHYLSGPSARAYLNLDSFASSGIAVRWFEYSDYPVYPQLWGAFEHRVTILDVLFNCGPSSRRYINLPDL